MKAKNIPEEKASKDKIKVRIVNKFKNKRFLAKFLIILAFLIGWTVLTINPRVSFDNNPVRLWVNNPSYGSTGEPFECTVEAWDWSERLSKSYNGEVRFDLISYDLMTHERIDSSVEAVLPKDTRFIGTFINTGSLPPSWFLGDVGKRTFECTINTPGIHYIVVEDDMGLKAISNPIRITYTTPSRQLLWGDIHAHTAVSDGSGTPEQFYEFARDTALLDFCSLTDHGEGHGITTAEKPELYINYDFQVTENFNEDDEFVAFNGMEWTTNFGLIDKEYGYGHYTMISDASAPIRVARGVQKNPTELWQYLDEYCAENNANVIALPHHLTQTNFEMDWAGMNPKYVKTVCVFSVHGGCLLQPDDENNHLGMVHVHHNLTPGASAADALKMGYKIGLVANSDSHDGHPGHAICHKATHYPDTYPVLSWTPRYGHPYPGGLTGVWTEEHTRKGILNSIRELRVLGTRAPYRPIIHFSINGQMVGENNSTLSLPSKTTPRNIQLDVFRDGLELGWNEKAEINGWDELTVEIWKNSELWKTEKISNSIASVFYTDTTTVTGTSYEDCYQDQEGKWHMHERALLEVENPDELNTNGQDYYFARVFSGEGTKQDFTAWIGPIWVG